MKRVLQVTPLRQRMIDDMTVRNLSPRTREIYVYQVAKFAQHFGRSPALLGPEEIRRYQLFLIHERQVSWAYFNQTVCGLRFLYRVTLGKDWAVKHLPFPKKPKKLPVVLSLYEIAQFFRAVTNRKHRAILMTAYSAGLRTSEVTRLRVTDIDSQRMLIHVEQGKGRKDRYVMLSPTVAGAAANVLESPTAEHLAVSGPDRGSAHQSERGAGCVQARGQDIRSEQARHRQGVATQLRNSSAGSRNQRAHDSGTAGASQPPDHGAVYARVGRDDSPHPESAGPSEVEPGRRSSKLRRADAQASL